MMRLPMCKNDGAPDTVDTDQVCRMVDRFLERGFCYFDTAHGYLDGQSETALRTCLTSRHPRHTYRLTNKLSGGFFKTEADIRPLFESQLAACGVEYFDIYLLHSITADNYDHFCSCNAFAQLQQLKAEGKIRHIGFSFHDKPDFLTRVLTEHPEMEVVQIQFNYADYEDPGFQSHGVYEVLPGVRQAGDRDGAGEGRPPGHPARRGRRRTGSAAGRQRGQLRDPVCRLL